MQCPFCREELGVDQLQLHCLVCTSAYAGKGCHVVHTFVARITMSLNLNVLACESGVTSDFVRNKAFEDNGPSTFVLFTILQILPAPQLFVEWTVL